jgi:uncharacterized protein YjdB
MPLTIGLNGNGATASFQEFDGPNGTGNPVPPTGAVSFASDNTAVATVDPSSGAIKAVGVGTCNISGTDAGNSLSASDALTVTDQAVSAVLTLTANAPQGISAAAVKGSPTPAKPTAK